MAQELGGQNSEEYRSQAFQFQLDMLKIETDLIDQTIARFDEHARATRNWAIVTWAGSIALALGDDSLRKYVILTAVLPVLFWLVDARWTTLLRRFWYRQDKITEFINSAELVESFRQQRFINFTVLDPRGKQYKGTKDLISRTNMLRSALKYSELSAFYFGLMAFSIALGLFFLTVAIP